MRLATYNVEWFNSLFADDGSLYNDGNWSSRRDVTRAAQTDALGHVFRTLDADAVMVIEAPDIADGRDGRVALERFARHFNLRTRAALSGFTNQTQQEIILLYDPDTLTALHDPAGSDAPDDVPRFDGAFRLDIDIDAQEDAIVWSKPPLEVMLETVGGSTFRMIGVHAKSKAPHGARGDAEVMRISISNRRKQLAQCVWLRERVERYLHAKTPLIVLGDFNDGPGLDEYEKLFGRSGVEIVLGHQAPPDMQLHDPHAAAALSQRIGAPYATSRFYVRHQKRYLNALLDYVMTSADLTAKRPDWRIWHPFDDPTCWKDETLRNALLTASDHFPVTLDIAL
ncbi:endonuclease/exonuclease/phosphatase family protein [Litoreibacter roseus]|uniref:Endonuclease n=1 Tax=Litoreibacter roseus TaxID=2601869 RepID=A0A6N6JHD7_9RHOB|nr:endonuclease/exonuclease/phosphatase family protein [Litoreibacter roseus]GFE65656.1 endonuclease [Litoreibacter roseus]